MLVVKLLPSPWWWRCSLSMPGQYRWCEFSRRVPMTLALGAVNGEDDHLVGGRVIPRERWFFPFSSFLPRPILVSFQAFVAVACSFLFMLAGHALPYLLVQAVVGHMRLMFQRQLVRRDRIGDPNPASEVLSPVSEAAPFLYGVLMDAHIA